MDITTALAQAGTDSSINYFKPISSQIDTWLSIIRNSQYSVFVSNLILVALAIAIVALTIFAGWLAMYPDKSRSFFNYWRQQPWAVRWEARYRRLMNALVRRFSPHGAYGLSFTLSLIILGIGLWAFGSIFEDVVARHETVFLDTPIIAYIVAHRLDWLTAVMKNVSILGNGWFVIILTMAAGLWLRFKTKSWRPLIFLAISVAGAGILDLILKATVARSRPPAEWMAASAAGYGFPSGHAAITAIYGALAYLLAKTRRSWEGKTIIWATAVAVALLIGSSRVYLGVHWPTDVLGGWALALVWLGFIFISVAIIDRVQRGAYTITGFKPVPKSRGTDTEEVQISLLAMVRKFMTGPAGLTDGQVRERIARGQVNITNQRTSRSYRHIFISNIFTRFNALLGSMFIVILFIGTLSDSLFGIIIMANTVIGIIQEVRAKWALDKLAFIVTSQSNVVRAGQVKTIPAKEIVVDDLVELHAGQQITIDGIVVNSNNLEVDESLLTGESEPVVKAIEDKVYSGSFVVAGSCRVQAVYVGEQAYARRLAKAARHFSLAQSELRRGINKILKYVTWLLVPSALLLFASQLLFTHNGWRDAVSASIAGVINMIPDGLVLLTSIVMAVAIVRLASRRALIQELAAVEMLARVDVLCLDKTGTLTEGKMTVDKIMPTGLAKVGPNVSRLDPQKVLGMFAATQERSATLAAIAAACPPPDEAEWKISDNLPFSSARKWSALTFEKFGSWILGAPEMVLAKQKAALPAAWSTIDKYTSDGQRVLVLAYTKSKLDNTANAKKIVLPPVIPVALIILRERLRDNVVQTLQYFKGQGVTVKIISGDSPQTVSAVAAAAGLASGSAQSGLNLPPDPDSLGEIVENHSVFGRITPEQKKLMVAALQKRGHVVAMIGDGVNDILAIKKSDFGIAMGSGTESSRAIGQLILVDNNFSVLPGVIAEGRRIIANIERTANLFISKTAYIFALALAVGVARAPFPFLPRHLTLIAFFTIGVPSLLLSLAPNTTRARSGFVSRVMRFSMPAGGISAAITLTVYALTRQFDPLNIELARTAATLTLLGCGLSILALLIQPSTTRRNVLFYLWVTILIMVIAVPSFANFFGLVGAPLHVWAFVLFFTAICYIAVRQIKISRPTFD